MNARLLLYSFLSVLSVSCEEQDCCPMPTAVECTVSAPVTSKAVAIESIIGNWQWIKTTYPSRISGLTTETPSTTGKNTTWTIKADKLLIVENDELVAELDYVIGYWGEGTANEEQSVLVFATSDPGSNDTSSSFILRLDTSFNCLTLVGSYDDAGGDLTFSRRN